MSEHLKHECGVFGVYGHPEAANLTYLGLHGLQHRGQESAGIATSDGTMMRVHRQMGLVADVFDASVLERLPGPHAIGHVRYSTSGDSVLKNAQPFTVQNRSGHLAIAHNGNLVNSDALRCELEGQGDLFFSTSDTEVIAHLMARSRAEALAERFAAATERIQGAYSLLMLAGDTMVAARDPRGFRPLILGRRGPAYIVSSESCAFDLVGATLVRELKPGEVVTIDSEGLRSSFPTGETAPEDQRACVFELIYFARPDSRIFRRSVYGVRRRMGRILAKEQPAPKADAVIPVPDSGVGAALGYAEESGLPFEMGFIRSHYVGRTFIEPSQSIRHFGVRLKLNPVRKVISGRSVVVVDDSIVRATTSKKIVSMLRAAGAREVHLRISCPPIVGPCFYGIDTPERSQLIAASHTTDEVRRLTGADSLGHLSRDGMLQAANGKDGGYCDACFTNDYPVPPDPNGGPCTPFLFET